MDNQTFMQMFDDVVMQTYTRKPLVVTRARGSWVWMRGIKEPYLDFFPGWAVSGIGHCHPRVVKAVCRQAQQVLHVSNNYYNELQGQLAERIIKNSFEGKVFFCNSGAEANEAAFKLARIFGNGKRHEIISMESSFHGRTLACIAATGQPKYQQGFQPMPEGFKSVPFNDRLALEQAITDKTVGILLELIQGEGGIRVASQDYVRFVRDLCFKHNLLMIVDEVQTGMGRTGKYFCFQNYGIEPDVMTLAKSLGGGVPIGATVVQKKYSSLFMPGMHASTFGGSPLACSAGLAVFEAIDKDKLLQNTVKMGTYLYEKLVQLKGKYPVIKEIRGMGLMLGVEMLMNASKAYETCLEHRLLINCTQGNTLRIMPAMTVKQQEIDMAIEVLEQAIAKC